jgi:serine/threonine-protein kinase
MRAWDSVTQGGMLRPGPAALGILLAGLLLSLAPVSQRVEGAYHDALQRLRGGSGSDEVVIVDTRGLERDGRSVWESSRFPDLLAALGAGGARLVIAVEPPPATAVLPDVQLATLAELEQRSRAGTGVAGSDARHEAFGRQLTELRRRSELQSRTVRAAAGLRNLIVSVPTFEGAGSAASGSECTRHALELDATADQSVAASARRVRAAVAPPAHLCDVALGAGHVEFWPDPDGVVRRLDLLVNASGAIVPAAMLRAALAVELPPVQAPTVEADSLRWNSRTVRTTEGPALLMRFYDAGSGFETVASTAVLGRGAAERLEGRFVILGQARSTSADPGYLTPTGDRMAPARLVATALSNLVEDDYVVRPRWMGWGEVALLVLLGVGVLTWGARLAPLLGVMIGVVVAASLLATEAVLLLHAGVWAQLATPAAFALFGMAVIRHLRPLEWRRRQSVAVAIAAAGPAAAAGAAVTAEEELDLAFSMLRHQPPSPHVKQRLYDVALEHARRHDLAKAERVLRHLASVDPGFRNAGEKLKKLAGLRNAAPAAAVQPAPRPAPPVLQPEPQGTDLTGRTIGRYQLEQPIGRGAMATVYLGRDPKINRRVAIKTIALAEEFSDSDLVNARTQFLREAESAGRLNHPNIISIYDAGEDGAVAYLAMEYFPGKPLSHYAQQGQLLPPKRVFELMARAAEALHYAHGQHVVHRDVKPANLLYDSSTDSLKITDFGIARLTDTSRTKTGIILGTPSYMSPEQLAGTNVSGQSDLFSLGITLYQLLCGMPPFRADSIPRLMQKIAHERHEPITRLRDDLPACVDEVFDRALAKNPADRYPSGRAMALALRDCCSRFGASTAVQPS